MRDVMDTGSALVLFVERVKPNEVLLRMAGNLHTNMNRSKRSAEPREAAKAWDCLANLFSQFSNFTYAKLHA